MDSGQAINVLAMTVFGHYGHRCSRPILQGWFVRCLGFVLRQFNAFQIMHIQNSETKCLICHILHCPCICSMMALPWRHRKCETTCPNMPVWQSRSSPSFEWQVVCFTVTSCWTIPIPVGENTRGPTVILFLPVYLIVIILLHPASIFTSLSLFSEVDNLSFSLPCFLLRFTVFISYIGVFICFFY